MSDLIKKVKIKKQDGTYTDYIPIGAEAKNIDCADGESVEYKLNKKPYYYNCVVDMKADTKLKVDDMAITLGYYEPNDGGGAEYRIINGEYVDDGGSYHKLENNLYAELIIKNNSVNVKQFGAKGNDITDDTASINSIFTYVKTHGGIIFFPIGIYKVTSPIRVDWNISSVPKRPPIVRIEGCSVLHNNDNKISILKGYNIPNGRAVLELVGGGNTWTPVLELENMNIYQDENTCDENSFCFWFGDSYSSKIEKVRFRGYNDVLLRCGSYENDFTYSMINTAFIRCDFKIFTGYSKGFSILPEWVLTNKGQYMDNLTFDRCAFSGLCVLISVLFRCISCHIAVNIPSKLKTIQNIGKLNGYEVDYSTGFLLLGGKNFYFDQLYCEDYRRAIECLPIFDTIDMVNINNSYFNSISNQFDGLNNHLIADYGIKFTKNLNNLNYNINKANISNSIFRQKAYENGQWISYNFNIAPIYNDNCLELVTNMLFNEHQQTVPIAILGDIKNGFANRQYAYSLNNFIIDATIESVVNYTNNFKINSKYVSFVAPTNMYLTGIEIFLPEPLTSEQHLYFAVRKYNDQSNYIYDVSSDNALKTTDGKYLNKFGKFTPSDKINAGDELVFTMYGPPESVSSLLSKEVEAKFYFSV